MKRSRFTQEQITGVLPPMRRITGGSRFRVLAVVGEFNPRVPVHPGRAQAGLSYVITCWPTCSSTAVCPDTSARTGGRSLQPWRCRPGSPARAPAQHASGRAMARALQHRPAAFSAGLQATRA